MPIICINVTDKILDSLESKRGDISRSLQYRRILQKEIEELEK